MRQAPLRRPHNPSSHQAFRIAPLSSHARQAVQRYQDTAAIDEPHAELLPRLDAYV